RKRPSELHDPGAEAAGAVFGARRLLVAGAAQVGTAWGGVRAVGAQVAATHLADHAAVAGRLVEVAVVVVVGADVARLLGAFLLFLVSANDGALDHLARGGVDRVGDVGVELGAAIGVADGAVLVELVTARVAVTGTEVVLAAAGAAAIGELAARHGDEAALGSFDDLQVTHDQGIVERD